MATKFYAVKKGLTPGVYTDWETCKSMVDGFPGAIYKSFKTEAEAAAFAGVSVASASGAGIENIPSPEPGCAIAYVDGSFREGIKKFAYGVVLFVREADGSVSENRLAKAFANEELLEMRNVAGEIMGSGEAMKRARALGIKKLTIYHDYEGIAKWCTGEWKANKVWTQKYKAFYQEISKDVAVTFIKVKGHSNDKYNDLADELAKGALEEK